MYSDSNERDHFPVAIESSDSRFFTKELYEMMHANYSIYGAIELYGVPEETLSIHFSDFFSSKEVTILKKIIGVNP